MTERCEDCGKEIPDNETVWVRAKPVGDRTNWNKPQCIECWDKENPGRDAVFIDEEDK